MDVSNLLENQIPLLDPHTFSKLSLVSHAHGDHVAFNPYSRTRIIVCTPETADIIKLRTRENALTFIKAEYEKKFNLHEKLKETFSKNSILSIQFDDYNESFKDIFITFFPAGHILGSAQILIEVENGKSLLYSGDFKLQKGLSCDPLVFPKLNKQIDFLIMESTFAKSKYIFPELNVIQHDIIKFCNETLDDGYLPILLGYSLGKSQEIIKILQDQDFNIIVHGSIFNISNLYKKHGVSLGQYFKYSQDIVNSSAIGKRSVIIIPPHFYKHKMVTNIVNRKVGVCTGWAIDSSAKYMHNADTAFALSDHADYKDLLEYAQTVNAKKTFVLHGFSKELSWDLNKLKIDAEPFSNTQELRLF